VKDKRILLNVRRRIRLAVDRSVFKDTPLAFHNDWSIHWSNELESEAE
jgi:hypothetical protein